MTSAIDIYCAASIKAMGNGSLRINLGANISNSYQNISVVLAAAL
jgi:hypothetical protein